MDEKSKIYLGFMLDGASRMRQLIQDLLQYSRADRPEQFTEPVSVEAALKVALLNLEAAIPCPEQQLTVHRPLPVVHCGKRHLAQILQNLLSNAAKYQQPDQALSITLSTEQTEAADILHITDNGIGIEEQYHERIFQVFQRLHPRHRYSGTGIGLAICRRLVTHYNGTITVSSTPDAGSTFTLTFPRPRNQP